MAAIKWLLFPLMCVNTEQQKEITMKKMLQTRHRLSAKTEADWSDEQIFGFNKFNEVGASGAKFLRTIDRDRYEIRWVEVKGGK